MIDPECPVGGLVNREQGVSWHQGGSIKRNLTFQAPAQGLGKLSLGETHGWWGKVHTQGPGRGSRKCQRPATPQRGWGSREARGGLETWKVLARDLAVVSTRPQSRQGRAPR